VQAEAALGRPYPAAGGFVRSLSGVQGEGEQLKGCADRASLPWRVVSTE